MQIFNCLLGNRVGSPKSAWVQSLCLGILILGGVSQASAQYAAISDAWWTYQQDCNGDGCKAGTLPGNQARLNWAPVVTNCNGALTVFEKVYYKSCGTSNWFPLYTNTPHSISGCRSTGHQYLDVTMGATCACRDFKIEIYRDGESIPDHILLNTSDPDLSQHREQLLVDDYCLSDFFASCVSLSGHAGSEQDQTSNATKEPGEPNHAGNAGGHSLWFCWSTTNNTVVTCDTLGSTVDTLLAVYTGNNVSNLVVVASNDDIAGATNRLSKVTFTPVPNTIYHIAVDGFGGANGLMTLNWNQATLALPDLISWGAATSPTVITRTFVSNECEVIEGCATPGLHRLLSWSTETRNIGSGDLIIGDPATNSLFRWASCHQHYHFEQFMEYNLLDTNGNIAATGHKVGFCLLDDHAWSPTANPSSKYDCNNQGIQAGWADVYSAGLPCQYIDITTVPPGDYILQMTVNPDKLIVEANYENNTSLVPVSIPPPSCATLPPNDNFTNAKPVGPLPFTVTTFNSCATEETGEPLINGPAGKSLWFNWTPAASQTIVINTKRSDFDTMLGVYTGSSVSNLTLVATNDDVVDGIRLQSQVTFAATGGVTYHIMVDGYGSAVGMVVLNVGPPVNDDFADAITLSGKAGATNGYNIGASKEESEPSHASDVGGHSLWFNWTAPAAGPVDLTTGGSDFDTTLGVYTGTTETNLVTVASNDDDIESGGLVTSHLWFTAVSNTVYRIAIDGFGGSTGNYKLAWNMNSGLKITNLSDGSVDIVLTGIDWQRYALLGSTNFTTWNTNINPITMAGGAHHYTNYPGTNVSSQQFFKAVRLP